MICIRGKSVFLDRIKDPSNDRDLSCQKVGGFDCDRMRSSLREWSDFCAYMRRQSTAESRENQWMWNSAIRIDLMQAR